MNVGLKKHTKQISRLIASCLIVSEVGKGEEIKEINSKNREGDLIKKRSKNNDCLLQFTKWQDSPSLRGRCYSNDEAV
jgi:hypothetical protein